jgi:hypothetical protein
VILEEVVKVGGIKPIELSELQEPTVDEEGSSLNRAFEKCLANSI